jgi:DNA-binding MurR/RpiR family transcriptional regulator
MNFPPSNFEELRQIVILLRQGDLELPVGRKILHGLELMINNPELVAPSNIVELSKWALLSPASITRLSKLLGFEGFNKFKIIFKQKSKLPNDFYSDRVKRLIDNKSTSAKELLTQQLTIVKNNIERCIENTHEAELVLASSLLAKKHRIFIFGHRQSSAIANIFRYGLALIRPNVQMLVQVDHGVAIALGQLKKEDLLVVIGSSPYSNITVKIASLAHQQGCQILAITDSKLSPFMEYAAVALQIPTEGQFYANSTVTSTFIIEALLCLTATQLGQVAVNNLQRHEVLLSHLNEAT